MALRNPELHARNDDNIAHDREKAANVLTHTWCQTAACYSLGFYFTKPFHINLTVASTLLKCYYYCYTVQATTML